MSTSIQTFRRALVRRGHRVTLIAPSYGQGEPEEVDVLRIPSRRVLLDPEDRLLRRRPLRRLVGMLRERDFDLVHIQTPFIAHHVGVRLSRELRLPSVESYHTFFEEYLYHYLPLLPRAWMRHATRRFSRRQCNQVGALVVPSTAMLEVLRGYGVHTPAAVVPTGIELDRFPGGDGARFRARHGIDPARPVLVHIGRVAHEKNIGFLLDMLDAVRRAVPRVLLVIAGEGPAEAALRRQVGALGLAEHVLFVGYLDRTSELLDCYRAGEAFVFASRTETQGLVLLEAMALGVPVVSTAVMGTRDILADGRGALVPQDDPAHFAAEVVRLLRDPGLRKRLAREATEHARRWSAEDLGDRLIECYRDLLLAAAPAALRN